jgi:large subunit ribosomal protein L24
MKIHQGDAVIVTTGNSRGMTGTVSKVFKKQGKVLVDGVNKRIKHVKARQGQAGERLEFFAPIDASNIAVVDPKTGKATRIGYKIEAGQKVRFAKSSGTVLAKEAKATAKKVAPKKTAVKTKKKETNTEA